MNTIELIPIQQPIHKTVSIPGSKSYTNRALIMAALSNGTSTLTNCSLSDDSKIMIESLQKLGIEIAQNENKIIVKGNGGNFKPSYISLNVEHAGTAMRFLISLCCLVPGKIILDGSERMRNRPIKELVDALNRLGAKITYLDKEGFAPIQIQGGFVVGGQAKIVGNISSQFITSLLLIGPVLKNKIKITIAGNQISKSYVDMTIDGLKHFGVIVKNNKYRSYVVEKNQSYIPQIYAIEADISGASYLWGIAAVTKSTIRIQNVNPNSAQGDVCFADILKKMGCNVIKNWNEQWIEITGPQSLNAVAVDMGLMPDTAQTLTVIAAFAKGTTRITGLSTLKVKETDRLVALKNELAKMNIQSQITKDSISVVGGSPASTEIETYKDHRMALAFSVAGTKIPGVRIIDSEVVSKSFPNYWDLLRTLGIQII